jgi:hypothetical protein
MRTKFSQWPDKLEQNKDSIKISNNRVRVYRTQPQLQIAGSSDCISEKDKKPRTFRKKKGEFADFISDDIRRIVLCMLHTLRYSLSKRIKVKRRKLRSFIRMG